MNTTFNSIFVIEMGLKNIALGPSGYLSDSMNCFDGFIVLVTVIDWSINLNLVVSSMGGGKALSSIRVLRSLRVLRVTKLLRSLTFMKLIIKVMVSSFVNFVNICKLLKYSRSYGYF